MPEVRLYDNLFSDPNPDAADKDFLECLNPDSLEILTGCKVEAGLARPAQQITSSSCSQAISAADSKDSAPASIVFTAACL